MATRLYTNYGAGGTDGAAATNLLMSAGGDNPLLIGGASGWAFEADDRSPDGPPDGLGFRRESTGVSSYLRNEYTPTGDRNGGAAWFYMPATQTADWNFMRAVSASELAVIQLTRRSTGTVWMLLSTTAVAASQSPVLAQGWYRFELIHDHIAKRSWYRIMDISGAIIHSWDSGAGAHDAARGAVAGVRLGEPSSGAHGVTTIRIGSRPVWGSLDSGWYPRNVVPWAPPPTPPPPTTAVSHYNTAEGLTVGDPLSGGVGEGTDGIKFSTRAGTIGTTIDVTDQGIKGSRAYVVKAGAGQAYAQWGLRSTSCAARMHLRLPSTPTDVTRVMVLRNDISEPVGGLLLRPDGQIMLQAGRETIVSRNLPGVVDYASPIRLQMWVNVATDTVHAAWGYVDTGDESTVTINADLGGIEITLAQFGKLLSSSWTADFVMDDLAVNLRASAFVGGWASSYQLLPTLGSDLIDIEPGTSVRLTVMAGLGSWTQVSGPAVTLTPDGNDATFEAPYTPNGATLVFDYGSSRQSVQVMRATELVHTSTGERAARLEIV